MEKAREVDAGHLRQDDLGDADDGDSLRDSDHSGSDNDGDRVGPDLAQGLGPRGHEAQRVGATATAPVLRASKSPDKMRPHAPERQDRVQRLRRPMGKGAPLRDLPLSSEVARRNQQLGGMAGQGTAAITSLILSLAATIFCTGQPSPCQGYACAAEDLAARASHFASDSSGHRIQPDCRGACASAREPDEFVRGSERAAQRDYSRSGGLGGVGRGGSRDGRIRGSVGGGLVGRRPESLKTPGIGSQSKGYKRMVGNMKQSQRHFIFRSPHERMGH